MTYRIEVHHKETKEYLISLGSPDDPSKIMYFQSGQEAAEYLKKNKDDIFAGLICPPENYILKVAPCITDQAIREWRDREFQRMGDGTYMTLPGFIDVETVPQHYAHVCPKNPLLIRYTNDDAHGVADKKVTKTVGGYLTKYRPDMPSERVAELSSQYAQWVLPRELQFAVTADEIEHVYTHGPVSCMSRPAEDYSSSMHPVRMYGYSDLQVAYITCPDDEDRVTARAVVYPKEKKYNTIYGDAVKLRPLLQAAGYTEGHIVGACIQCIKEADSDGDLCYIAPYLDGVCHVREIERDGVPWLQIVQHHFSSVACSRPCGHSSPYETLGAYCEYYEERQADVDEDELITVIVDDDNSTQEWCPEAVGIHAWYCAWSETYYSDSVCSYEIEDTGETVCWDAIEDGYAQYCEYEERYYSSRTTFYYMEHGENWCEDAFNEAGFTCAISDKNYKRDEGFQLHDGTWLHEDYLESGDVFKCTGNEEYYYIAEKVVWYGDWYSKEYIENHLLELP